MHLRFILPLINVVLAAAMFHVGDWQADRFWEARRRSAFVEPVPDSYARARYLEYALNAPAWATLGIPRGALYSRSPHWTSRDLRYFIAVVAMWYWLGLRLDERIGRKAKVGFSKSTWKKRTLGFAYVLYGIFLCHLMVPEFEVLYNSANKFWLPFRQYELWFIAAVVIWGLGLVAYGCHLLVSRSRYVATADSNPV